MNFQFCLEYGDKVWISIDICISYKYIVKYYFCKVHLCIDILVDRKYVKENEFFPAYIFS